MVKKYIFTLITVIFSFVPLLAQEVKAVGIGTQIADPSSVLELKSSSQGFLLPRLTTNQRDGIQSPAVGLIIFNLDTKCIESFTGEEWIGNCGSSRSKINILNCDTDVAVNGTFEAGQSTANTSLNLTLNVTKKGSYTITASPKPDNGYYYYASGVFVTTGTVVLKLTGLGSPREERTASNPDKLYITLNDIDSGCTKDIVVAPFVIAPAFTVTAIGSTGVGIVKSPLNSSTNYMSVSLSGNASALGATYDIPAVTANGMTFGPASGTFTQSPQTIVLPGTGAPINSGVFPFAIITNSITTTSAVTINYTVAAPTLKLIDFNGGGYGADADEAKALITSSANFGTSPTSIVKSQGFTITDGNNIASSIASNPDIIVIHYPFSLYSSDAAILKDYLDSGGVVLYFSEQTRSDIANNVATMLGYPIYNMNNPFNDSDVTERAKELFNPVDDMIIKGPFGDLTGLSWTDDGGGGNGFGAYPVGSIIDYCTNNSKSRVWRSTAKNLFFVGDGGWLAQNKLSGTSPTTGANSSYNSALWGNIMAWAVTVATTNGINYKTTP